MCYIIFEYYTMSVCLGGSHSEQSEKAGAEKADTSAHCCYAFKKVSSSPPLLAVFVFVCVCERMRACVLLFFPISLQKCVCVCFRQDLKETFIDSGVMTAIKEWISPLPDKSLPALRIREELLKILQEVRDHQAEWGANTLYNIVHSPSLQCVSLL